MEISETGKKIHYLIFFFKIILIYYIYTYFYEIYITVKEVNPCPGGIILQTVGFTDFAPLSISVYLFIVFPVSVCLSFSQQGGPGPAGEFERLLKESQKEVLRLQRQLSVSSARDQSSAGGAEKAREEDEAHVRAVSYFTAPPCGFSLIISIALVLGF